MPNEQSTKQEQKIVPLSRFNDYYDFPKVGAIRQMIFKNTKNFKNEVMKYVGARQYVDVQALWAWVDKTNTTSIKQNGGGKTK